jgi:hypothetical protein
MASGIIGYYKYVNEANKLVTEIQNNYSDFTNPTINKQGIPQPIEQKPVTAISTKGEFREVEKFIKIYMNQMVSQRNDYLLEVEACKWREILDPKRIKKDDNLTESKMIIQNARNIVKKYRVKTYTLIDTGRKNIESMDTNNKHKQGLLVGFNKGTEKASAKIDAMWDLESQVIAEIENIFTLLTKKKGDWEINEEGTQILFASGEDLNTFNSCVSAIQGIVEKQMGIQKESNDSVNNILNNLKN